MRFLFVILSFVFMGATSPARTLDLKTGPSKINTPNLIDECNQWFYSNSISHGVIVLTHGQNMNPRAFDQMANRISKNGFDVFRASFSGHCGELHQQNYLNQPAKIHIADAQRIYREAKKRAEMKSVPLFLIANSFSALIFQTLASELVFSKRVFLAPALAITLSGKIFMQKQLILGKFNPHWVEYKSFTPAPYAANEITGLSSFQVLEYYLNLWKTRDHEIDSSKTPTLILDDPNDFAVSASQLKEIANKNSSWRFAEISHEHSLLKIDQRVLSHLIADEESVGPAEWARILDGLILPFLRPTGH